MPSGRRVAVAMSGGVDSSVAAALAVEAGGEVVGLTLKLLPSGRWETESGCCSAEAASDARAVAAKLGIRHYVLDAADEFERCVVAPFARDYALGLTPNPCVACNETVKFGWLVRKARELGCDALVTGHYARTETGATGTRLFRASDPAKDQSYFLWRVAPEALAYARFPVGVLRKTEVRERARALGLAVAEKPDSNEVCFVHGDEGHAVIVGERHPDALREGEFVDARGRGLGRHAGLAAYTVGQRRGLGLPGGGERRYVLAIDPAQNRVVLGAESELDVSTVELGEVRWLAETRANAFEAEVKIRSTAVPAAAVVTPRGEGRVGVAFSRPARGVAPGQSAVLYVGDELVGGGVIGRGRNGTMPS